MDKIEMVPVEWLAHHPDNPRSDMEQQLLDGTHPCYQEDAGV